MKNIKLEYDVLFIYVLVPHSLVFTAISIPQNSAFNVSHSGLFIFSSSAQRNKNLGESVIFN